MLLPYRHRLATLAAQQRLPAIYGFRQWMEAGGLMFYGPDFADLLRRVATYAIGGSSRTRTLDPLIIKRFDKAVAPDHTDALSSQQLELLL